MTLICAAAIPFTDKSRAVKEEESLHEYTLSSSFLKTYFYSISTYSDS